jgi:hypothetical protein
MSQKEYKVFDLRDYESSTEAYKDRKDWLQCWDEDQEEYLPHILIFKGVVEELTENTYGPDNNYTDYSYRPLDVIESDVIEYLKEVE